jgi:hypothetical protein
MFLDPRAFECSITARLKALESGLTVKPKEPIKNRIKEN